MLKNKLTISLILIFFLIFFGQTTTAALVGNTSQATLTLTPQTGTFNTNSNFQIGVYVNTNSQNVVVVAAYLNYNPAHFQVTSIDTANSVFTMEAEKTFDNTNGVIKITRGKPSPGVNTSNGLVATINFRAISGVSPSVDNLTFQFVAGATNESNVIKDDGLGTDILSGVYNGRYTVIGGTDTTPPTISSVGANQITSNSAVINWITNEPADSQVEYGRTTSYGSQTTLDTSMVTFHSVSLSGLSANTTYHYRVKSKDASGNLAVSQDYTFTTGSQTCTNRSLASSSVIPNSVLPGGTYTIICDYGVTTNGINPKVGSGSCVFASFYGTAAHFNCTAGQTVGTFSNYCTLSNIPPDYYCSRTDKIANLTVSATPSTPPTPSTDTVKPTMPTNFSAKGISSSQVSLSWSASTDNVGVTGYKIERCKGSTCLDFVEIGTTAETSYLDSGLLPKTTYRYRIRAFDAAGNVSNYSNMAMVNTLEKEMQTQETPTTTPQTTPTPSVPIPPVFNKDLYLGIKDFQVEILQKFLSKDKTIYPEGQITGYFGPATQRAVQRFQCKYKILCSGSPFSNGYGMVGPTTRAKLNQLYKPSQEELIALLKEQIKILQEKIAFLQNQINQLLKQKGLIK